MKHRIDGIVFGLLIGLTLVGLSACWARPPLMGKLVPVVSAFVMRSAAIARNN